MNITDVLLKLFRGKGLKEWNICMWKFQIFWRFQLNFDFHLMSACSGIHATTNAVGCANIFLIGRINQDKIEAGGHD